MATRITFKIVGDLYEADFTSFENLLPLIFLLEDSCLYP